MGWTVIRSTNRYVFLRDLDDGGKTITNAAESVLKHMARYYPRRRVIYESTDGTSWELAWKYVPHRYEVEFRPRHGEVWDILTRPY